MTADLDGEMAPLWIEDMKRVVVDICPSFSVIAFPPSFFWFEPTGAAAAGSGGCAYFLSSTFVMGGLPDRHRPVPRKLSKLKAWRARPMAKHARNCGANKNARAERRLVVKDGQQQSSIRELITKEVGLCGR